MSKEKEVKVEATEEVKKPVVKKKRTYSTIWFEDNCKNDKDIMITICNLTAKSAEDQFMMHPRTNNNEIFACIFFATLMNIIDYIKGKQKTWKNFTLQIANSINIGYCNNDDDDNEKVGNFQPILEHIGINQVLITKSTDTIDATHDNFCRWKTQNIKRSVEYYKEIQERTYEYLISEFAITLPTSEAVFPLFCIFMDYIVSLAKLKYQENEDVKEVSEIHFNVLGLFDIYYSYDEDGDVEHIDLDPGVSIKLRFKNDTIATD